AAGKEFGAARGGGVEIYPVHGQETPANARGAGGRDRVEFRRQDFFEAGLREATGGTLYLGEYGNLRLRPKLLADLKAGTRVVSHAFGMGPWKADETRVVSGRDVFLWTVR